MEDPIRVYRKECIVHKVTNKSALLLAVKVGRYRGIAGRLEEEVSDDAIRDEDPSRG